MPGLTKKQDHKSIKKIWNMINEIQKSEAASYSELSEALERLYIRLQLRRIPHDKIEQDERYQQLQKICEVTKELSEIMKSAREAFVLDKDGNCTAYNDHLIAEKLTTYQEKLDTIYLDIRMLTIAFQNIPTDPERTTDILWIPGKKAQDRRTQLDGLVDALTDRAKLLEDQNLSYETDTIDTLAILAERSRSFSQSSDNDAYINGLTTANYDIDEEVSKFFKQSTEIFQEIETLEAMDLPSQIAAKKEEISKIPGHMADDGKIQLSNLENQYASLLKMQANNPSPEILSHFEGEDNIRRSTFQLNRLIRKAEQVSLYQQIVNKGNHDAIPLKQLEDAYKDYAQCVMQTDKEIFQMLNLIQFSRKVGNYDPLAKIIAPTISALNEALPEQLGLTTQRFDRSNKDTLLKAIQLNIRQFMKVVSLWKPLTLIPSLEKFNKKVDTATRVNIANTTELKLQEYTSDTDSTSSRTRSMGSDLSDRFSSLSSSPRSTEGLTGIEGAQQFDAADGIRFKRAQGENHHIISHIESLSPEAWNTFFLQQQGSTPGQISLPELGIQISYNSSTQSAVCKGIPVSGEKQLSAEQVSAYSNYVSTLAEKSENHLVNAEGKCAGDTAIGFFDHLRSRDLVPKFDATLYTYLQQQAQTHTSLHNMLQDYDVLHDHSSDGGKTDPTKRLK